MNKNCKCGFCKKPKWISIENYMLELSKFLGYPKCCTKEYITDVLNGKNYYGLTRQLASQKIREQFPGGEFMPCKHHAEKILNENRSLRRMIRKRVCSTPFPYSSISEFRKYLRKIRKKYEDNKAEN